MTIRSVLRRWALVATLAVVAVGGLALFSAGPARAEEGASVKVGEHATSEAGYQPGAESAVEAPPSINGKKLALQLLNFSVLLFILIKFGGPAIGKALAARHQQMKADLASASAARAEAEARLAQQEKRLGALEQEIESIRTGVKAEAQAEKARLIALAEERAKRIKEETSFALDQQVKEAEERLRREVALAAVDLAEQMVRKSMGAADQQRMVETFVTDVATGSAASRCRQESPDGGHGRQRRAPLRAGTVRDRRRQRNVRGAGAGDRRSGRALVRLARAAAGAGEPGVPTVGEARRAGADPAARGADRRGAPAGPPAARAPPNPAPAGHRPRLPRLR